MGTEKKKLFIKGMGSASDSRRSNLAKQAINAICGDTLDKETGPTNETPVNLRTEKKVDLHDMPFTQLSSELKHNPDKITEDKLTSYSERIACLEEQLKHQKDTSAKDEKENAICECCDRTDVKMEQLVKIDSGQMICNNCLRELRS